MPGRVVLFFPSYYSDEAAPPLALIHLAAPLVEKGYEVRIVDSAVTPDCAGAVLREAEGALALGISMVTGPMIVQGVAVARAVRERFPGLPIVAGGWHASILPEQTLRAPYIDAVVKGQGELTFLEIVERYARGERDLEGVRGALFKRDGRVVRNPERGYTDINALPRRPFELVPFEPYARKCEGTRWILYCTSHGCPWDCSYCSNASVYGRNWKPLLPETAVREMAELARRYELTWVLQPDWKYLEAALLYEDATTTADIILLSRIMLVQPVLLGLPYWLTIVFAVAVMVIVGMLLERAVLRPVLGYPAFTVVMVTIGVGFVIRGLVTMVPGWGTDTHQIPTPFAAEVWRAGGLVLPVPTIS